MPDFKKLNMSLNALSVFASIKHDEGVSALAELLKLPPAEDAASLWAEYFRILCENGCEESSSRYFARLVYGDSNVFARRVAELKDTKGIDCVVKRELETVRALAALSPKDFAEEYGEAAESFPKWKSGKDGIPDTEELKSHILRHGYGVFARSVAYRYDAATKSLESVENVSPIRLSDLKLYDDCKQTVADNTLSFIEGLPANNVLLYGDRGTGKSSTVHAVLNEYEGRGLRLLEVSKAAIPDFPAVFKLIEGMKCFKFIIFIDDLTFVEGTDDFAELKAALEGSVGRPTNALIYATSNRRHLVRERYEGRNDDLNVNDTVQEQMSLSDRFGLTVTFLSPDKREFAHILAAVLADRGIAVDGSELSLIAERYALRKGGRSGRAAKQLADMIESRIKRNLPLTDMF